MRHTIYLLVAAGALAVGCVPSMRLPPGFVSTDAPAGGEYHVRAVSADGVVVALRREANRDEAGIDFWTKAVTNELVQRRGYRLKETETHPDGSDVPARLLTFTHERQGVAYLYLVNLFVQPDTILIAEAGGEADDVEAVLPEIKKAFATVE
jgi:hypothetical protein